MDATPKRLARGCVRSALTATIALSACGSAVADGSSGQTRAGDVLSYAIPVVTLGTELLRGERDGALDAWRKGLEHVTESRRDQERKKMVEEKIKKNANP